MLSLEAAVPFCFHFFSAILLFLTKKKNSKGSTHFCTAPLLFVFSV
jgi:hypothetical protein